MEAVCSTGSGSSLAPRPLRGGAWQNRERAQQPKAAASERRARQVVNVANSTTAARATRQLLLKVLPLPLHGVVNAVPAAGMVEEDDLLDRAGAHLAVLAEVDGGLREAVGLAAGVDAVHVGLV